MKLPVLLAANLAAALANPALADETLFAAGLWSLTLIDYADNTTGCSTASTNADGSTFFYESWPTGVVAVSLSDDDWQFPSESVDESFGISINGGEIWSAAAGKFDNTVQASFDTRTATVDALIEQLMNGTSMEILSAKGTPITRFSLDGAAATLENHFECESRFPAN